MRVQANGAVPARQSACGSFGPSRRGKPETLNAQYFERRGGAVIVPDSELGRIPALVDDLLADPVQRGVMRDAMLALARPDAAEQIAEELIRLAHA